MRVLVACECSGRVRDAFLARNHDAWSCDLKPSEDGGGRHFQCDVRKIIDGGWDLMIAHPDCTYLTNSAEWAYKEPDFTRYPGNGYHQQLKPTTLTGSARKQAREEAIAFARFLMDCTIPKVCLENPTGTLNTRYRKPDQTIQPYQFGEDASKATAFWLKGLPRLVPTKCILPRLVNGKPRWANQTDGGQNRLTPHPDRAAYRSRTYSGIADAMADQWGCLP